MAKMFPPEMVDIGSPGERDIFYRLKNEGPQKWHVFHSARFTPRKGILREIDFLLLVPSQKEPERHWGAIICLEVKCGAITLDESGAWKTGSNTLKETPLEQARAEMYALKDYLKSESVEAHDLNLEKLPLAYAVVLPESPSPIADERIFDRNVLVSGQDYLKSESVEAHDLNLEKLPLAYAVVLPESPSPIADERIFDRNVLVSGQLIERIEELVLNTGRRSYKDGTRQFREFDQAQLNRLIDLLPSRKQNQNTRIWINSANIKQSERELAMLTEEQLEALSWVEDDTGV